MELELDKIPKSEQKERILAARCHQDNRFMWPWVVIILLPEPYFFPLFILWLLSGPISTVIIWLANRKKYPLVDEHGKEALNYKISTFLFAAVTIVVYGTLMYFASGKPVLTWLAVIPLPLFLVMLALNAFQPMQAAKISYEGKPYRYPHIIRFIR